MTQHSMLKPLPYTFLLPYTDSQYHNASITIDTLIRFHVHISWLSLDIGASHPLVLRSVAFLIGWSLLWIYSFSFKLRVFNYSQHVIKNSYNSSSCATVFQLSGKVLLLSHIFIMFSLGFCLF